MCFNVQIQSIHATWPVWVLHFHQAKCALTTGANTNNWYRIGRK